MKSIVLAAILVAAAASPALARGPSTGAPAGMEPVARYHLPYTGQADVDGLLTRYDTTATGSVARRSPSYVPYTGAGDADGLTRTLE